MYSTIDSDDQIYKHIYYMRDNVLTLLLRLNHTDYNSLHSDYIHFHHMYLNFFCVVALELIYLQFRLFKFCIPSMLHLCQRMRKLIQNNRL